MCNYTTNIYECYLMKKNYPLGEDFLKLYILMKIFDMDQIHKKMIHSCFLFYMIQLFLLILVRMLQTLDYHVYLERIILTKYKLAMIKEM